VMTKDERIAAAASDMGFDFDPKHLLDFLEGRGLTVEVKASECAHTASSFCGDTGCETHGVGAGPDDEDEDTEALIEQLDEALCTMLHDGGEVGEHSPRTHLDLFYEQQKAPLGSHAADLRCLRATQRALNDQRRLFVERAAIQFATHPQYNESRDGSGAYVMLPYLLNPSDAVREAVALWDAIQRAL